MRPTITTVDDIDRELERLASRGGRHTDAHWQLRAALKAYREHQGSDLAHANVQLVSQPLKDVDTSYNFTAATSIEEYAAQCATRLTGEDLEWQVAWYTDLVTAARRGDLPPALLHENGGRRVVVDGGHRLSAHRAAGLDTAPAYLVRA